jgi:hypothetical protein
MVQPRYWVVGLVLDSARKPVKHELRVKRSFHAISSVEPGDSAGGERCRQFFTILLPSLSTG